MHPAFRHLTRRFATLSLLLVTPLLATTVHVTPHGAGAHTGSDWANALGSESLPAALAQTTPGDTLQLGSGLYHLTEALIISGDGTVDALKTLVGVDTGGGFPVLQGNYDPHHPTDAASSAGLRFPGPARHWQIQHLRLRNFGVAIQMPPFGTDASPRAHLLFEDIDGSDVDDFIVLQNASDIRVRDCDVIRYCKKGFRYADYLQRLTFERCTADANGGDDTFPTRAIPNGFCGGDTEGETRIRDITFIDCTARNNRYAPQLRPYWNGDGFSTEEGTDHVTYIRCRSYDNHDGGFDDKADNTTYLDCVSIGNAKGFRYWGNNGLYQNCLSAYNRAWGGTNASDGIWVGRQRNGNLGVARVIGSTFFHNGKWALESYNGGRITATGCLIVTDPAVPESRAASEGEVRLIDCDSYSLSNDTRNVLTAPDRHWQGDPVDAYDPRGNPSRGYHSHNRTAARVPAP